LLFGASTPLAKLLLESADPWMLAGLLYLGSGVGLAGAQLVRRRSLEARLRGRDWGWLAAAVGMGGVAGPVRLLHGLAETSASSASLLLNLEGVLTALLAWAVFREHFHGRIALGMGLIAAGGLVLSWTGSGVELSAGAAAVAGACLAWAI